MATKKRPKAKSKSTKTKAAAKRRAKSPAKETGERSKNLERLEAAGVWRKHRPKPAELAVIAAMSAAEVQTLIGLYNRFADKLGPNGNWKMFCF